MTYENFETHSGQNFQVMNPNLPIALYHHHCARLEFGNFFESSPKFFREGGGLDPTFGGPSATESGYSAPEARGLRKNLGFFKQPGTVREGLGFFWKIEFF